jgi:uncharacterized protein YcaQ
VSRKHLTIGQARRAALAAQALHRPRPDCTVDQRHIRRVVRTLGLLQLDFVNVLVPAHYLVIFSRLGRYQKSRFNQLIYSSGEFTEQWAHEASIVPVDAWPLLAHRRKAFRPWSNSPITKLKKPDNYLSQVMRIITDGGAVTAGDLPSVPAPKREAGQWHRSVPRWALEYHFGLGQLAVRDRLENFQRVYDLPERLIDDQHRLHKLDDNSAKRELLRRAARAYGVATAKDLADYYRMKTGDALPRIGELVEEGVLTEVRVGDWADPAYLAPGATIPRRVEASALLSPFDPLVWYRPRAERLFDFHYRIEIYVPEHKRKWGYYVLPYLLGDTIVARVDLKADRRSSILLVRAAYHEDGADPARVAEGLARELLELAAWLDLDRIKVARRGSLSQALRKVLGSRNFSAANTRR